MQIAYHLAKIPEVDGADLFLAICHFLCILLVRRRTSIFYRIGKIDNSHSYGGNKLYKLLYTLLAVYSFLEYFDRKLEQENALTFVGIVLIHLFVPILFTQSACGL